MIYDPSPENIPNRICVECADEVDEIGMCLCSECFLEESNKLK